MAFQGIANCQDLDQLLCYLSPLMHNVVQAFEHFAISSGAAYNLQTSELLCCMQSKLVPYFDQAGTATVSDSLMQSGQANLTSKVVMPVR